MVNGFSLNISGESVQVSSFMSNEYDDIHLCNHHYEFLLEGVLLNKRALLKKFALKNYETLIGELYAWKRDQFFTEFEGEFRGFVVDKIRRKVLVFTNITATQRVFYAHFNDQIFIETNLIRLNQSLREANIPVTPDIEAMYELLCLSNMTERKTPMKYVYKLLDGHYLEIDLQHHTLAEKQYFSIADTPYFNGSKSRALDAVHEVFSESVSLEYSKDLEMGTGHLALLSGGLDSRIAMMYALKNEYKPDNLLCFSQSEYFDHTISKKIAADLRLHYEFIPLDGGTFLKKIDELTALSDGMVFYTGGIHVKHATEAMRYENFALFHSGQIGDGVLGGFNTAPYRQKPSYRKMVVNPDFLPKIQTQFDEILKNYVTEEHFLIRNIAYNRTVLGAVVLKEKRYQTSPFMSKDFLEFAISLPEAWKFKHRFYLEWMDQHCKEAMRYRWEKTLLKPDAQWKTIFGTQVVKRSYKFLNEKIFRTPQYSSMYPYQYYFDSSPEIQKYYEDYFAENIYRIDGYEELESDVRALFQSSEHYKKSQALNILAVFKLFF